MSKLQDDPFSETLGIPPLVKRYEKERDEKIAPIVEKYRARRDELIRKRIEGIRQDQDHRRILNACIFPFSESGTMPGLGYSFVRASPLEEKGAPNLDFLIFNPEKRIAIFGEAKGSVDDPGGVVDQTKLRIKSVNESGKYIDDVYLKCQGSKWEFVLGVSWRESSELVKSVLRKGGGIIVWHVGIELQDEVPKLSVVIPQAVDSGAHKTMRHSDDAMNRALSNTETSHVFKTFFLDSHPVAKMLVLTIVDKGKDKGLFAIEDLLALVREELDYLDESVVREEARRILQLGQTIGFVVPDQDKYRITSRSKKANVRESEMKDAWIRWSLQRDETQEIQEALKPIREKYSKERSQQTTL